MNSALLAVPVEIRLLDVGPRIDRVFRLAHSIAEDALRLERELPYERGRPVRITLSLPDAETPLVAEGRIERADLIVLLELPGDGKAQIARYVRERNLLS
jgi:hypothetical protein